MGWVAEWGIVVIGLGLRFEGLFDGGAVEANDGLVADDGDGDGGNIVKFGGRVLLEF